MGFKFDAKELHRYGKVSRTVQESLANLANSYIEKQSHKGPPPDFTFLVNIPTVNDANGSAGRSMGAVYAKARRHKIEHQAGLLDATKAMADRNISPTWIQAGDWTVCVHLARLTSSPKGMDRDGIANACKYVRDGVGKALGFTDDQETRRLDWIYSNQRAKRGMNGVIVTVSFLEPPIE